MAYNLYFSEGSVLLTFPLPSVREGAILGAAGSWTAVRGVDEDDIDAEDEKLEPKYLKSMKKTI